MSRAAAVPISARLKAGRSGTVAAHGRAWGLRSMVTVLITLSLVLLGEGAPGDLDPTFGVGGKVITDFGGVVAGVSALVLQPDGKLVAAGFSGEDFALARYLPDGSLDPTFGVGGKVITDFRGGLDRAFALVAQADGKLVAAGISQAPAGQFLADFALARYESQPVVNDFVTFEPNRLTFDFTPDSTGCPAGFVGTFSFKARLTNISDHALSELVIEVTKVTRGNLLQNADGGPGRVGARLTVPQQHGFTDGVLSPGEFVDVLFIICLRQRQPFQFEVDVLGVVDASADAQAKAQLVTD